MNDALTSHVVTLPTGQVITVEADTEDNARAAAALILEMEQLPPGTLVINAEALQ